MDGWMDFRRLSRNNIFLFLLFLSLHTLSELKPWEETVSSLCQINAIVKKNTINLRGCKSVLGNCFPVCSCWAAVSARTYRTGVGERWQMMWEAFIKPFTNVWMTDLSLTLCIIFVTGWNRGSWGPRKLWTKGTTPANGMPHIDALYLKGCAQHLVRCQISFRYSLSLPLSKMLFLLLIETVTEDIILITLNCEWMPGCYRVEVPGGFSGSPHLFSIVLQCKATHSAVVIQKSIPFRWKTIYLHTFCSIGGI